VNSYELIQKESDFPIENFLSTITNADVERVLCKDRIDRFDFLVLLSDYANAYLEPMAQKAQRKTRNFFGNAVFLFTPLYIANFCENNCPYCSFACHQSIKRKQLTPDHIAQEVSSISKTGIRQILLLTGESRTTTSVDYLKESITIIKPSFSSVGIEIYPLTEREYSEMVDEGVDMLTIYQEVYNQKQYAALHTSGPKKDYQFRLEAPDRAARGGVRSIQIGTLLGLYNFYHEAWALATHADYLQQKWPDIELSFSFPRIKPLSGHFSIPSPVDDVRLMKMMCAFRLLYPHCGITISTREDPQFRNGILPICCTRMSAGVSTAVGGHTTESSTAQFEIADTRTVTETRDYLHQMGLQAVMHDWHYRLVRQ